MGWPTFIIIGTVKGGSSQLFLSLNKHPDISMSNHEGPIDGKSKGVYMNFWNKHFDRGIDWYKGLFAGGVCGEKSPGCYTSNVALRRLKKYVPDVKLILPLRDPVARAYSHYQMNKRAARGPITLTDNNYVNRGKYFKHIKNNVLPYFDREQLHIVITERMKADPNGTLLDIHKFLGVTPCVLPVKTSDNSSLKTVYGERGAVGADASDGFYKVWSTAYEPISDIDRSKLSAIYRAHNEALFEFLGYSIPEWGY